MQFSISRFLFLLTHIAHCYNHSHEKTIYVIASDLSSVVPIYRDERGSEAICPVLTPEPFRIPLGDQAIYLPENGFPQKNPQNSHFYPF